MVVDAVVDAVVVTVVAVDWSLQNDAEGLNTGGEEKGNSPTKMSYMNTPA